MSFLGTILSNQGCYGSENCGEQRAQNCAYSRRIHVHSSGTHSTLPTKACDLFDALSFLYYCRYENTIGLLIERERKPHEFDGLKWYVPGTNRILYEEYFPCKDLATQLAPIITRYVFILRQNACITCLDSLVLRRTKQSSRLLGWYASFIIYRNQL